MSYLPQTMEIILEFEPIVKLVCTALDCQNNLANQNKDERMAACNLKHLQVGKDGRCLSFNPYTPKLQVDE